MKKNPEYPTPKIDVVGEAGLEFWERLMDTIVPNRELTDADVVELGGLCSSFEEAVQECRAGREPTEEVLRHLRSAGFRPLTSAFSSEVGDEGA